MTAIITVIILKLPAMLIWTSCNCLNSISSSLSHSNCSNKSSLNICRIHRWKWSQGCLTSRRDDFRRISRRERNQLIPTRICRLSWWRMSSGQTVFSQIVSISWFSQHSKRSHLEYDLSQYRISSPIKIFDFSCYFLTKSRFLWLAKSIILASHAFAVRLPLYCL